jgi:hypothetical protein
MRRDMIVFKPMIPNIFDWPTPEEYIIWVQLPQEENPE